MQASSSANTAPQASEDRSTSTPRADNQSAGASAPDRAFFAELPFLLGDQHPELRRLLHIHIPKTGGTSLDAILCARRETLPVPIFPEYLPLAFQELTGEELDENQNLNHLSSQYIKRKDRLVAQGKLRWLLPVTHIKLSEAIALTRDKHDVRFTLLRHPREQALSMLRFRIMHTLHTPDCIIHLPIHQFLGMTHAEFTRLAHANDPELFRLLLSFDTNQSRTLGFSPWLCLPGQPKSSEQMLSSIASHGIHCATAATMTAMVKSLTGLVDLAAPGVHRNRTDDLNHSGLRLNIDEAIITPFVEESSVELFQRLQEAGALKVWGEPTSSADDYWRCIDRALKAQARNSAAFSPMGKTTAPPPPSLALLRLLQERCHHAATLEKALETQRREHDALLRSRSWRVTAPYRRFRDVLARLRRRLP